MQMIIWKVRILIVLGIVLIYYLCNSFGSAVCFKLLLALQSYIFYPCRDISSALVSMAIWTQFILESHQQHLPDVGLVLQIRVRAQSARKMLLNQLQYHNECWWTAASWEILCYGWVNCVRLNLPDLLAKLVRWCVQTVPNKWDLLHREQKAGYRTEDRAILGSTAPSPAGARVGWPPYPLPAVASVPMGLNAPGLAQPGRSQMHFQNCCSFCWFQH